jgi:hypothetical protein
VRDGIVPQVLIISLLQNIVIIEIDTAGTQHLGKEGKFLLFEALILLFFCPLFILSITK